MEHRLLFNRSYYKIEMTLLTRNKIFYFILPIILVIGIYGSQTSYEKSDYFQPYSIKKSNNIMTFSIDKTAYGQGETMYIYGKINDYTEGVPVYVKIIDPTKKTVSEFRALADRSGIFTQFFVIPDGFVSGKYTLSAYYTGDPKKTLLSLDINIATTPNGYSYILIPFGAAAEEKKLNFVPPKIVAPAGSTITWINNDGSIHTVLSGRVNDDGTVRLDDRFQGGYISPGQSLVITPNPGNYTYFCKLHPWLSGTISINPIPVKAKPTPAPVTKPVVPVKPTTPVTKPVVPVKPKPVTPVTKPVVPVKPKPVVTGAANSTIPNSNESNTPPSPSTGSDNFLSAIWKSLFGWFTGGASSSQHENTTQPSPPETEPTPAPVTKPTPAPVTKPTPAPVTKPTPAPTVTENNGPNYFYDKFSSIKNWKIISGNWKSSSDGLHAGSLLGNTNQIILSPISSKNFTLDTSFKILNANLTNANYVSVIYSWVDAKNYEIAGISFINHHVYVTHTNVIAGKMTSDPTYPGKSTTLNVKPGNLFNVTISKQGKFEDLSLNGTKYLHREYDGNSGYIGLSSVRVNDVVFDHISIHKLDK